MMTQRSFTQPLGNDLQRFLEQVQLQRQVQVQQQAAAPEAGGAAKRQRLDGGGGAGSSAAAGSAPRLEDGKAHQPPLSQQQLAALSAPLVSSHSLPPLSTSGVIGGHAFLPPASVSAPTLAPALPLQMQPHIMPSLQLMAQPQGTPAATLLQAGGGGNVRAALLAAAAHQQQQHIMQQQHVAIGSGGSRSHSHSHDLSDSGGDGSGGDAAGGDYAAAAVASGSGAGRAGRRSSEERLTANKEKNRRAQQRFRMRQKEKLAWLEAELQRLRGLCAHHGIDPTPPAQPPTAAMALANAPGTAAAARPHDNSGTATVGSGSGADVAVAAVVPTGSVAATAAAATGPSIEQMYEDLESILDSCGAAIPGTSAIAYLTAWQRADAETQRCQYSSLRRRYEAGKLAEVVVCVRMWLGTGGGSGTGACFQQQHAQQLQAQQQAQQPQAQQPQAQQVPLEQAQQQQLAAAEQACG